MLNKQKKLALIRAALLSLGIAAIASFFGSGGDDDDCGCDDSSNDCDCSCHDSGADQSSSADFMEEAHWADYVSWGGPCTHKKQNIKQEKCSTVLELRPSSELKRIRRWAFILKQKKIKVGYNSNDLLNKDIDVVYSALYNQAFKHIKKVPLKTIGAHSTKKANSVQFVKIGHCINFLSTHYFCYDEQITIYYRVNKEITIPFSSKSLKKRNYEEVCRELERLGFSNIKKVPKMNVVAGWLKTDGVIDRVYINGHDSFSVGNAFPYDVEIVVKYDSRRF